MMGLTGNNVSQDKKPLRLSLYVESGGESEIAWQCDQVDERCCRAETCLALSQTRFGTEKSRPGADSHAFGGCLG
jgi:hypothetical protein